MGISRLARSVAGTGAGCALVLGGAWFTARAGSRPGPAPDAGRVVSVPGLKSYTLGPLTISFIMGTKGVFVQVERGAVPRTDVTWLRLPLLYLSAPTAQRVIDNKIVVVGEAHGGVKTIVVLDRNATRVKDSFWCMSPSLSPDRRYIAYTMVTQPHAAEAQTEFAAVYDLTKNASENRAAWTGGDMNIDVGELLYPRQDVSVRTLAASHGPIHSLGTKYTWTADSREILFSDSIETKSSDRQASSTPRHYDLVARNGGMGWLVDETAR